MNYRREIDGLRAVAILPVILFHAGFAGFTGGFTGVDVFFVISGYLITTLIVSERQENRFSIIRFYERRARRILPALFFVMAASFPVAWWLMLPADMQNFSRSLIAVPLFVSNIMFKRESGYFDVSADLKPMLHTWSLAIEEQYYVLFPLLIMLVWKTGRARIGALLVVLAVASLAYGEYKIGHKPSAVFYLLPYRAWELLIGALCALYLLSHTPSRRKLNECGSLAGLGLIAYGVITFNELTRFPGLHALVPTVGAALIILFARPETLVGKLLCSKPFVGIGLISYSAYLWHWPIFALMRIGGIDNPGMPLLLAASISSLILAYLSWRYIEKPFRDPSRVSRRAIFTFAFAGSLLFIAIGLSGKFTGGFEHYFYTKRLNAAEQANYTLIKSQTGDNMYDSMIDDGKCNFWAKTTDAAFTSRFDTCAKQHGKALIVLGDSHAMNIYNALARAHTATFLVGVSQGGCRPHDNSALCHYNDFATFLNTRTQTVQAIIYHQSGSYLLRDYMGQPDSIKIFAEGKPYSFHMANIEKLIAWLNNLSTKAKVIWLGPFVEARFDFRRFRSATRDGFSIREKHLSIFESLDAEIKRELALEPHSFGYYSMVDAIHMQPEFLKQGDCITYRDADHFSKCGEEMIGTILRKPLLQRSK